jgi:hypothetical protein
MPSLTGSSRSEPSPPFWAQLSNAAINVGGMVRYETTIEVYGGRTQRTGCQDAGRAADGSVGFVVSRSIAVGATANDRIASARFRLPVRLMVTHRDVTMRTADHSTRRGTEDAPSPTGSQMHLLRKSICGWLSDGHVERIGCLSNGEFDATTSHDQED